VNRAKIVRRARPSAVLAVGLAATLVACEMEVSNPGPVEDSFLDDEAAHAAVVYGAMREFNGVLATGGGGLAMCGAVIARELHPSGQQGSFSCSLQQFRNQLTIEGSGAFNGAQLARWLAETGIARIKRVRGDRFRDFQLAAPALLYAGYSNRLLGEHVCKTVIDGGPELDFKIHFARADSAFTEALAVARHQKNVSLEHAALAGRASVRIWRGDWTGALEDAALVPETFSYATPFNTVNIDQSNSLVVSTSDQVRRNFSTFHTFYGENFDQMKDPRTPYRKYPDTPFRVGLGTLPDLGDGRGAVGAVPYWQQRKYIAENAPIELSSGREMRLILAEGRLRANDLQGAMAIVNEIRTKVGVAPRTATTLEQAWTWVKLEKLIELWMEGRAVGERRRWFGDGGLPVAPGALPALLRMDDRFGKDRCWPISEREYQTNTNLTMPG
jgi:hypothetical protein